MTFHSVQFKLRLHAGELKEKYFLYIMPNTGLYFHTYLICDSKKKTPACTMSSAPDQRAMWGTTLEPGDDVVFKCLRTLGTGTGG